MASIRSLKKIINLELALLIDDCYETLFQYPDHDKALNAIIDDAVNLFDQLIIRVNDFKTSEKGNQYFNAVESELNTGIDQLRDQLEKIVNS